MKKEKVIAWWKYGLFYALFMGISMFFINFYLFKLNYSPFKIFLHFAVWFISGMLLAYFFYRKKNTRKK